jgi:hypothetical protein
MAHVCVCVCACVSYTSTIFFFKGDLGNTLLTELALRGFVKMRRVAGAVVCGAAALMAITMVAQTVRLQLLAARRTALTQKLFDVDGPSSRDPPREAWDHAGKVRNKGRESEEGERQMNTVFLDRRFAGGAWV